MLDRRPTIEDHLVDIRILAHTSFRFPDELEKQVVVWLFLEKDECLGSLKKSILEESRFGWTFLEGGSNTLDPGLSGAQDL